jgi:hypothetical protein
VVLKLSTVVPLDSHRLGGPARPESASVASITSCTSPSNTGAAPSSTLVPVWVALSQAQGWSGAIHDDGLAIDLLGPDWLAIHVHQEGAAGQVRVGV